MVAEPELDDLYRDMVMDHYRNPRHARPLAKPTVSSEGLNPLCGDEVTVQLLMQGDRIVEAAAFGAGCAISRAATSLMTEAITGRMTGAARELSAAFGQMLTMGSALHPELGDLEALHGVSRFPVRIKCALLPWKVLSNAIEEYGSAPA